MYKKFDIWKTDRENPTNEHYLDLNIKKDTNLKNYPTLTIWKGKAQNPFHRFYYHSIEQMEKRLEEIKQQRKKDLEDKAEYNERAKIAIKNHKPDIFVGQVWVSSWGYDQTNIDYYEVVKISGKAIYFQEIGQFLYPESQQSDTVKPDRTIKIGKVFKKILQVYYNDRTGKTSDYINLNSYSSFSKWNGTIRHQTNPMFGH